MGSTLSTAALGAAVLAGVAVLVRNYAQLSMDAPGEDGRPGKNAKRNKKRRENLKAKLHPNETVEKPGEPAKSKTALKSRPGAQAAPQQPEADEDFPSLQQASAQASTSQSQSGGSRRPLAERRAPKARQGKMADMLDPEVDAAPTMARVVKITKQGQAVPQEEPSPHSTKQSPVPSAMEQSWVDVKAPGPQDSSANEGSISDFESEEVEQEEAWEQVPSKASGSKAKAFDIGSYSTSSSSQKERVVPGLPSKKARQNAAKKAQAKSAREAAESERLASLQAHRSTRAAEAAKQSQRAKMAQGIKSVQPPPQQSASSKALSGGMRYGMSDSGNLIWE